jgi:uncharacterized protein
MAPVDTIRLQVAYSAGPRHLDCVDLTMPVGSTLAQALEASGLMVRYNLAQDESLVAGVWMKLKPLDTVLREADRVEVYRPLTVDPKEARRQRYRKQPKPG